MDDAHDFEGNFMIIEVGMELTGKHCEEPWNGVEVGHESNRIQVVA